MDFTTFSLSLIFLISFLAIVFMSSIVLYFLVQKYGVPDFNDDITDEDGFITAPHIIMYTEEYNDKIMAYEVETSRFIAQGKDDNEVLNNFRARFPQHIGIIVDIEELPVE